MFLRADITPPKPAIQVCGLFHHLWHIQQSFCGSVSLLRESFEALRSDHISSSHTRLIRAVKESLGLSLVSAATGESSPPQHSMRIRCRIDTGGSCAEQCCACLRVQGTIAMPGKRAALGLTSARQNRIGGKCSPRDKMSSRRVVISGV